jgi:cytochrome o ubiquinol oxidase subunit 3
MSKAIILEHQNHAQLEEENTNKSVFGFWVYIMTDCVLFASLFAVYAVLHKNVAGGPSGEQIFSLPYVLTETIVLLTSSFTCGLAMLSLRRGNKDRVIFWFSVTFALGLLFLGMELSEFRHLAEAGNSWRRSGFLSSYFTLVGTHGLHITVGLIWMFVLIAKVFSGGLTKGNIRRLTLLSLFWHFLDIIWIFIFTIVYLMGAMGV